MVTKLQSVSELSAQTAKLVAKNVNAWKNYLTIASRLYKYHFDEQLLIYAQRPDATACAQMGLWNKQMHRWVKSGSKGIALIQQTDSGRLHLSYIFDITDTHPVNGARKPYLWEMQKEHEKPILAALSTRYGEANGEDFAKQIMEFASRTAKKFGREALDDLGYDQGKILSVFKDVQTWENQFIEVLTASVQYTLLSRCGIVPDSYVNEDALSKITLFSTPAMLHHLGNAVSTISMELLLEIGKSIRTYEGENLKNLQKKKLMQRNYLQNLPISIIVTAEKNLTL